MSLKSSCSRFTSRFMITDLLHHSTPLSFSLLSFVASCHGYYSRSVFYIWLTREQRWIQRCCLTCLLQVLPRHFYSIKVRNPVTKSGQSWYNIVSLVPSHTPHRSILLKERNLFVARYQQHNICGSQQSSGNATVAATYGAEWTASFLQGVAFNICYEQKDTFF